MVGIYSCLGRLPSRLLCTICFCPFCMRHCKSRFSRGKHLCMCLGSLLTLFSSACLVRCCLYLGYCTIHITNYGKVILCSSHGNLSLPLKEDLLILYHAYLLQLLQHCFNFILQAVKYAVEHSDTWIYLVCPVSSGKRLWVVFWWRFELCIILPGKEQFGTLGDNPVGFVVALYWKIHLCLHMTFRPEFWSAYVRADTGGGNPAALNPPNGLYCP